MLGPQSQLLCWVEILIFGAVGMVLGAAFGDPADNPAASEVSSTVAARYYSSRPQSASSLPKLPRCMFLAMLLSLGPLLRKECPGFISQNLLFFTGVVISVLSTGGWLLVASALGQNIDNQRRTRINGFIADPTAPAPAPVPGLESYSWLKIWNWTNTGYFVLLLVVLARNILLLSPAG
jgi:hypothetical protein